MTYIYIISENGKENISCIVASPSVQSGVLYTKSYKIEDVVEGPLADSDNRLREDNN